MGKIHITGQFDWKNNQKIKSVKTKILSFLIGIILLSQFGPAVKNPAVSLFYYCYSQESRHT